MAISIGGDSLYLQGMQNASAAKTETSIPVIILNGRHPLSVKAHIVFSLFRIVVKPYVGCGEQSHKMLAAVREEYFLVRGTANSFCLSKSYFPPILTLSIVLMTSFIIGTIILTVIFSCSNTDSCPLVIQFVNNFL